MIRRIRKRSGLGLRYFRFNYFLFMAINENQSYFNEIQARQEAESASNMQMAKQRARVARNIEKAHKKTRMAATVAETYAAVTRSKSEAVKLAMDLRHRANDLDFDGMWYWGMLIVAGSKDLFDILSVSSLSWAASFPVALFFFVFLFLRRSYFKKIIVKWGVKRLLIILGFEILPGTSFFPGTTFAVFMLHRKIKNKRMALMAQAEQTEKKAGVTGSQTRRFRLAV